MKKHTTNRTGFLWWEIPRILFVLSISGDISVPIYLFSVLSSHFDYVPNYHVQKLANMSTKNEICVFRDAPVSNSCEYILLSQPNTKYLRLQLTLCYLVVCNYVFSMLCNLHESYIILIIRYNLHSNYRNGILKQQRFRFSY